MLRYYSGSRADRVRKPLSPPRQCGAFAEHMLPIPTKFFVTSGKAVSKVSDLNAFDEALQNAGLAEQNIVSVSSVLPIGIKPVRRRDLPMGAITHCVLAQQRGGEGEPISPGNRFRFPGEGARGYLAEFPMHGTKNALPHVLKETVGLTRYDRRRHFP